MILLVEDDGDDAFFFRRTLKQSGIQSSLSHVLNGGAAIEFLRTALASNSLPRIIFLDLKMPVLNGFDVLAWMQKQVFPAPIPVVVLSGSEQRQDKDRARGLGATDYLVKPVRVADLHHFLGDDSALREDAALAKSGAKP